MKKTGMAKSDAKKLMGKMTAPGVGLFDKGDKGDGPALDRREQRKLDQSLGLIPFAVKLNSGLVLQLQTLAKERKLDLNVLVGELLTTAVAN